MLDDVVGEVFDKVFKMLGLGYLGGKVIDDFVQIGVCDAIDFFCVWLGICRNFFLFSGFKIVVKNYLYYYGILVGQGFVDLCVFF